MADGFSTQEGTGESVEPSCSSKKKIYIYIYIYTYPPHTHTQNLAHKFRALTYSTDESNVKNLV